MAKTVEKVECRKAVVLAAGLGTRLRPFTLLTPKPLMPVWNEPILALTLDWLRECGVTDFAVNAHYLADQIDEFCRAYAQANDVKIRVSRETEILGTGGVLNPLRDWIGEDDFYLVNGDIVFDLEKPLAHFRFRDAAEIGVALVSESGPRTVEVEPQSGFITCWKSDDAGCPGTFTYCGVTRLKAKILAYVAPEGFSTIIEAYEKAMAEGFFIRAEAPEALLWTDAGSIDAYIDLNRAGDENALEYLPQLQAAAQADGAQAEKPVEFMGARGSDRVFFKRGDRVIVVYDPTKRGENAKYAAHAAFLAQHDIHVPKVVADLPEKYTLVMNWGGIERKMSLADYAEAVAQLVRFNALADDAARQLDLEAPFDEKLYAWEHGLFEEYCLNAMFGIAMSDDVRAELKAAAERLLKEPTALVHRDFQSTNILWRYGEKQPCFIDFQGMRLGAAVYDLASLLYDPYVELSDETRAAMIKHYANLTGRPDVGPMVAVAAVQRLCQCLGAYGRLASVGQQHFMKYVLPALCNLLTAADEAGMDAIGALAEDLLGRIEHHHHDHDCECHHEHDEHECHCHDEHNDHHECHCHDEREAHHEHCCHHDHCRHHEHEDLG